MILNASAPVVHFAFLFRILPNVSQPHVFLDESYVKGNISTRDIARAKLWKTRAGAERWIGERGSQAFNDSQIVKVNVWSNGMRELVS